MKHSNAHLFFLKEDTWQILDGEASKEWTI